MKPDSVDALLFDLGGVVIDIDFNRAFSHWANHSPYDLDHIRSQFGHDIAYKNHEVANITTEEYFEFVCSGVGADLTYAQFLAGWNAIFVGEFPGISDLLANAAALLPTYAFSNSNPAHEAYWSRQYQDVLSHFNEIFVSSTIKLRKPDPDAFRFVVEAIGVPGERILFFDDSLENVAGARACGLQAVQVTTTSDVAEALAALEL